MSRRVALVVCVVVLAVALAGVVAVPGESPDRSPPAGPALQTGLPTVDEAPPGTVFRTRFSTRGGGGTSVGLVKRGASGDLLFNPSLDFVSLSTGDTLVARSGRQYRVTRPQTLAGGSGFVGPGATVYRGERGIRYTGFAGRELVGPSGAAATGSENATAAATLVLNGTVPTGQPTGVYREPATGQPATDAASLTVREPRVTDLRVFDKFGRSIGPGDRLTPDNAAIVVADVNFLDASRARLVLVDSVTGRTETAGVLTRRQAQVLFPVQADAIGRVVPEGFAQPEGTDGTARSLANPVHGSNGTVYLVQYLRPIRQPGRYEFVVGADDRPPFGDLYDAGVWRTVRIDHTLSGTTFLGFGEPVADDPGPMPNETAENRSTSNATGAVEPERRSPRFMPLAVELRTRDSMRPASQHRRPAQRGATDRGGRRP